MKFVIFQSDKNKKFYFNLKAKNGQVILSSQGYATKASAMNGIASVQKYSSNDPCFERKIAKNGKLYFNLLAGNKRIVGSSQMYSSKSGMEKGISSVKKIAPIAELVFSSTYPTDSNKKTLNVTERNEVYSRDKHIESLIKEGFKKYDEVYKRLAK